MMIGQVLVLRFVDKMGMSKIELTNVVKVNYYPKRDKNDFSDPLLTAIVSVPEDSLPPMSEEDKKCGGRLLNVYFEKAAEILENEIGPISFYTSCFIGKTTVLY